jgi:transposase-like protein
MTHLEERKLRVAKRQYTKEFREFAVERLRGCENIGALAKEQHVSRRQLYRWPDEMDLTHEQREDQAQRPHHSQISFILARLYLIENA